MAGKGKTMFTKPGRWSSISPGWQGIYTSFSRPPPPLRCIAKSPKSAHAHWVVGKWESFRKGNALAGKSSIELLLDIFRRAPCPPAILLPRGGPPCPLQKNNFYW
jgi:hypothetical protein